MSLKIKEDHLILTDHFCQAFRNFARTISFMDIDVNVLIDPQKNEIHLSTRFNEGFRDKDCVDKDLSIVILKPAMIIVLLEPTKLLYHLRSVGWGVTVLLK